MSRYFLPSTSQTQTPFAFDKTPRTDIFGNPIDANNDTYWGTNHNDLQGVLEIELNDADGNFNNNAVIPSLLFDLRYLLTSSCLLPQKNWSQGTNLLGNKAFDLTCASI